MTAIYVKPRPGLRVRDPESRTLLPENGARVPNTAYWRRRLAAGDVVTARRARRGSKAKTDSED